MTNHKCPFRASFDKALVPELNQLLHTFSITPSWCKLIPPVQVLVVAPCVPLLSNDGCYILVINAVGDPGVISRKKADKGITPLDLS